VGLPDDGPGLGPVRDEPPVALGEARQALQGLGAQRGGGAQRQEPDHRAHPHRQPAPIRRRQYVVEEAVVVVPQALVVRGGGDEREVLEELRGDVLVRRVVCSSTPATGRAAERSIGPMLSRPRKPPSKTLSPWLSFRLTHHVKLISSLWKTRARKSTSRRPSMANTRNAAHACTGGLTSPKAHS
jgi:hypothetical protein